MNTLQIVILVIIIIVLLFRLLVVSLRANTLAATLKRRDDDLAAEQTTRRHSQISLNEANHTIHRQQRAYDEEMKNLRDAKRRLNDELFRVNNKRSTLEYVKFYAKVPCFSGHQKTEFKLGLGPCGLVVTNLSMVEHSDRLVITKNCENGERKTFDYYKTDIAGRIEKRWAA